MTEPRRETKTDRSSDGTALALGGAALLILWALVGVLLAEVVRGESIVLRDVGLGLAAVAAGLVAGVLYMQSRGRRVPENVPFAERSDRLTSKSLDYLVSLLNVTRAVSAGTSVRDLGQVIVDSCMDCFDCQEASMMTLDHATDELAVAAFAGHKNAKVVRRARVKMGQGVAGTVAQNRTPLILGPEVEAQRFPGFKKKQRRIQSSMVAPIVVRGRVEGVLNVSTGSESVRYTEDDLRVLCILAEHAGIVVAKARDQERVMRLIRRIRRRGLRPLSVAKPVGEKGESPPGEPPSGNVTRHAA